VATGNITQTSAAKLLPELWAAQPEYVPNNVRGFTKSIWDTGETYFGPGYKVHVPIVQAYAASAYSGTLTFNNFAETELALTPTVAYNAIQIQEDVLQTIMSPGAERVYSPALAEGLYQKPDVDGLIKGASLTNSVVDSGAWTIAGFQSLISTILTQGGDKVQLGQLDGWYHPQLWDTIMATADMYSAAVRGESNSSAKTGNVGTTFGVNMNFTKNVYLSTTLRNVIVSRKTMILVRKNRPKIEMERTDLTTKIVASMMYAIDILHDLSGGQQRVTTTT
jgi:hypothetical protein